MDRIKLLLLLCLIGMQSQLHAQFFIKGVVKDSANHQAIPFATVGIAGTTNGTITNSEGAFVLTVEQLPANIQLHAIGYQTQVIQVSNFSPVEIKLVPITYSLTEVTVSGKEVDVLFKKSYQLLQKQHSFFVNGKCFYRLLSKQDDQYTELIEAFYSTTAQNSGIKYSELEHGRYALVKNYLEKNYVVSVDFSLLSRYVDVMNEDQTMIPFPLFPYRNNALKDFSFTITDRIQSEEGTIAKVQFKPRKQTSTACFSGYLYINTQDYRLVRVVANSQNDSRPPFFIFNKDVKLSKCNLYFDIRFAKHPSGVSFIKSVNMKIAYDELSRKTDSLKHHVETYSNMLFYQYTPTVQKNIVVPIDDYLTDYDQIKQTLYIRAFWDENPMLAETPVETRVRESFEASRSFGKAFNQTSDTLDLLHDGYLLWDPKHLLSLDSLKPEKSLNVRIGKLEITHDGEAVGGLYGDLYFVSNCYHDSFYYCVLPLFDLKASWAGEELRRARDYKESEWIYQHYFDLLECYKRKFKKQLLEIKDICQNRNEVNLQYNTILKEFNERVLAYLNDVLGAGIASDLGDEAKAAVIAKRMKKWDNDINDMLEDYDAYK